MILALVGGTSFSVTAAKEPPPPRPVEVDPAIRDAARLLLALAREDAVCEVPEETALARRAVVAARSFLIRRPTGFRDDCSGFASAVYTKAGVPMNGNVTSLWDLAVAYDALHWDEVPRVGDLIFWDQTYDKNRNGLWDDPLTHVGVVIDVEPDGTVVFAHSGTGQGRTTGRMNLRHPSVHYDRDGRLLNTWVREQRARDPEDAAYLAGELWVAFATVGEDQDWQADPDDVWPGE